MLRNLLMLQGSAWPINIAFEQYDRDGSELHLEGAPPTGTGRRV
jgi:hypothetical protein